MKQLNELFTVSYGNKLDLNKMEARPPIDGGINFVGRSSQNNGVSGTVSRFGNLDPYSAGLITVALGGTKILSSFVQEQPFYTAQNVAILSPKSPMTFSEKLYVCLCIRHNRFRYSAFGREANRTLRFLPVPDQSEFPSWVQEADVGMFDRASSPRSTSLVTDIQTSEWKEFILSDLFNIQKGKRLTKANMIRGTTPFVGSTDSKNGVTAFVGQAAIHDENTISLSYNGSVAEAFYQPVPFWATDDVNVLYPKFNMTPEIALFICTIIRQEKYRFNYGRKWHLERMRESVIKLPTKKAGTPDYEYMERYIQSLPYSSQI